MNQQAKNDQAEKPSFVFRRHENGSLMPAAMVPGNAQLELAPVVYEPRMFEEGMSLKLGLFEIEAVKPPVKIYGDVHRHVDRYFRTYERREENVAILLLGQKGSGKTTTARCAAATALALGMPIIQVSQLLPGEALVFLMSSIQQNCLVIFDEVDKTYGKVEVNPGTGQPEFKNQTELLRILDGSVGGGKKLFMLIGNKQENISPYLINRPSRVRYTRIFSLLPLDVLLPYVKDNLKDCTDLQLLHFKKYRDFANGELNFDMVQGLVEEMNVFKLSLYEAASDMFGTITIGGGMSYLCVAQYPDGTTQDHEAFEGNVGNDGYLIRVNGEHSEVPPVAELTDTHFVGFENFGTKFDLVYEKDGVKYTFYPEHTDPSSKKLDQVGTSMFAPQRTETGRRLQVLRNQRWVKESEFRVQREEQDKAKKKEGKDTPPEVDAIPPAEPNYTQPARYMDGSLRTGTTWNASLPGEPPRPAGTRLVRAVLATKYYDGSANGAPDGGHIQP